MHGVLCCLLKKEKKLYIIQSAVGLANGREIQKTISDAKGIGNSFIDTRVEEKGKRGQNNPKVFPQARQVSL